MLRLTIRDLFWLTLVVAMGIGWWVDRGRESDQREAAERTLERVRRAYDQPWHRLNVQSGPKDYEPLGPAIYGTD